MQNVILVVDDNDDLRSIFRTILESRGYAVLEASNGEEGVRIARARQPDLVFIDLMMPVLDGWQALARLREDPATAGIPVAAVSASEPDPEEIRAAGFCAFVPKPFLPADIARAAELCLEEHGRGATWIADLAARIAGSPEG